MTGTKYAAGLRALAEVVIGKQRNGPVGTVKLVFLQQYARFENVVTQRDEVPF